MEILAYIELTIQYIGAIMRKYIMLSLLDSYAQRRIYKNIRITESERDND